MTIKITTFAIKPDGTRNRSFVCNGCTVLVTPNDASDEEAAAVTEQLATLHDQLLLAQAAYVGADRALAVALAQISPKRPARLLGPGGYVRFLDGRLILLNRRERGFGEFGVECEGWDDLFRRYDVRVTNHGADEHGAWWLVVSP